MDADFITVRDNDNRTVHVRLQAIIAVSRSEKTVKNTVIHAQNVGDIYCIGLNFDEFSAYLEQQGCDFKDSTEMAQKPSQDEATPSAQE